MTLVVLSGGIVFVYKSFFLCADYLRRISARLHASLILEQIAQDVDRQYKENPEARLMLPVVTVVDIDHRPTDFYCEAKTAPLAGYPQLLQLDVSIRWMEGSKGVSISRQTLLTQL